eukprot:4722513-Amphidinium_carterae.1
MLFANLEGVHLKYRTPDERPWQARVKKAEEEATELKAKLDQVSIDVRNKPSGKTFTSFSLAVAAGCLLGCHKGWIWGIVSDTCTYRRGHSKLAVH